MIAVGDKITSIIRGTLRRGVVVRVSIGGFNWCSPEHQERATMIAAEGFRGSVYYPTFVESCREEGTEWIRGWDDEEAGRALLAASAMAAD